MFVMDGIAIILAMRSTNIWCVIIHFETNIIQNLLDTERLPF